MSMAKRKPDPEPIRLWWTTAEVAEAWEVSERTLWRWLDSGRFSEGLDYTRAEGGGGAATRQLCWTDHALPSWVQESTRAEGA
jgi:hypothetical protein